MNLELITYHTATSTDNERSVLIERPLEEERITIMGDTLQNH